MPDHSKRSADGFSPTIVYQTITPPYTPTDRTQLVTDMLNHAQEEHDYTDKQWDQVHNQIRSLTDSELAVQWDATVGEWLLNRSDIPRHDHEAVRELAQSDIEHFGGDGVIAYYQKFKRLDPDRSADYGFLSPQTYRHQSDVGAREIDVELTDDGDIVKIASTGGLSVRECRMLLQQIEHHQEVLRQLSDTTESRSLSLPADKLFGPEWDQLRRGE